MDNRSIGWDSKLYTEFQFIQFLALFHKNKCVAGIIFNPSSDEMFYGSFNQGSFCNGKKLEVSKETNLKKSLIFVALPSQIRKRKIFQFFQN